MAKFKVWVSTDKIGSKCEDEIDIPDEDLEHMSEADIEENMKEVMFQMIEWSYEREPS